MSKSALVVDDSKSARFALRKYLENHGYKVDAVEGAAAAYDFLKMQLPDIIFLDHIMPEIDGFQALMQIKADARTGNIPTVICSSNEGAGFNEEARGKGAAAVLQKPPSPDQLLRVLNAVQATTFTPAAAAEAPVPSPAAAPEIPAATPAKVTNIREPEVAIEQAVMKALRSAMPAPTAAARPEPAAPAFDPAATGRFDPSATGRFSATPGLREQIDERIRKVTQDLFVQVASLRADIGQMEERVGGGDEGMREEVHALRSGLEALEHTVAAQIAALQDQIASGFAEQTQRLEQLAQAARKTAADEAHAVAERAVMAAAARVSDQLASSIMQAFRSPPQRQSEG